MRVALFYTAVSGFALGVLLRSVVAVSLPEIALVLLLSFVLAVLWRRAPRQPREVAAPALLFGAVFLLLVALGALRLEVAEWSSASSLAAQVGEEVTRTGTVVREPDERAASTHLYVDVAGETILIYADPYGDYAYGDVVSVSGTLARPEAFTTELGREFDYPGYLAARDVELVLRYATVEATDEPNQGHPLYRSLLDFKHAFMTEIEQVLPEPAVGLSEGLLLGVKRALGKDLEAVFRETGIIHIVVLSGYNIMLVVALVTFVLAAIVPFRFQLPLGVLLIGAFALMVGLSATVLRASLMACLYLIARATGRTYLVVRALALAGVVMLLFNPYLLAFDTGFQLSFVATLGLILLAPHLDQALAAMPKWLGREFLVATLATQIFVLPILLYQIGEFSVVAVMVNVLVLPLVPVAMLLTFITGLVGFISPLFASAVAIPTYFSLSYIITVAEAFAALPFASYAVPAFPFGLVVLSYAGLAYLLWRLRQPGLRVTADLKQSDELVGWTIEEETMVRERLLRKTQPEKDTPIFFR